MAAAAPFIAAIIVTWWLDYPFYRLLRLRAIAALEGTESANAGLWNRRQYIFYNIRHQLLFILVPVSLILLLMDSLSLYAAPRVPAAWREQFLTVGSVAAVAVVFLLCPPLIVRVWRSAPLPAGEMREQLQSACRRLKLRCRDLLVWRSANTVANAGVIGLVGPLRYVLVSDSLLANMDQRGIKAIFSHEAGHILHRHIFYSAIFAVDAAVLCSWAGAKLASLMSLGGLWGEILAASFLLPTWAMGFGALSRLFERQSDVTGAYFAGLEESPQFATEGMVGPRGSAIFAAALQQVARLNGIAARQWNWRHGSIASRVSFILWLGSRSGKREEIDRKVRLAKGLLWLALLVAAILVANEFI